MLNSIVQTISLLCDISFKLINITNIFTKLHATGMLSRVTAHTMLHSVSINHKKRKFLKNFLSFLLKIKLNLTNIYINDDVEQFDALFSIDCKFFH